MDRAAVRKLDSSGKVTIATIAESILPALSVPEEQADWGFLLVELRCKDDNSTCSVFSLLDNMTALFTFIFLQSKYTTVAQQLDSFWSNIDPLLCVSLPIPKKPTPPNTYPSKDESFNFV